MESEDSIELRLRVIIVVMFGLGITAAVIGTGSMRFFLLCFFVPGGWALVSPRWPAILLWIMWSSTIGLLGVLLTIGTRHSLFSVWSHWLVASITLLLFFGLPLVRRLHDAPNYRRGRSRIPEARIHRP